MRKKLRFNLNTKAFLGIFLLLSSICAIVYSILIINIPATYVDNIKTDINKDVSSVLMSNYKITSLEELQSLMKPVADKYHVNIDISNSPGSNMVTTIEGLSDEKPLTIEDTDKGYFYYTTDNMNSYVIKAMTDSGEEIRVRDVLISQIPIMICIVFGLSVAASLLVARLITRPISKLSETSMQLAQSQDTPVPYLKRKDEIGQLANNLSGMYNGLQQSLENEHHQRLLRDKLFQSVSHELKTPITILQGELEGMLYNMGDYKDRDTYIAHSLEVTQDMAKLVHKILEISKSKSTYDIKDCDISQLVFEQCQRYITLANQKEIDFVYDTGSNITVPVDEEAFGRAISNLLSNAIKYSPSGASVELHMEEDLLYIENSGVTLPEDHLQDLFEPFVRLEESHNRDYGGSGLGLYIVKSILEVHKMTYEMENTETGVRFTIHYDFCNL